MEKYQRKKALYAMLVIDTIFIGMLSRTSYVPELIYPYLGDFLYAVMMFFIIGFIFNKKTALQVAIVSVCICYGIEALQLYQADWIVALRSNILGKLILGSGFLWSDIASYTLGGLTGYFLELIFGPELLWKEVEDG